MDKSLFDTREQLLAYDATLNYVSPWLAQCTRNALQALIDGEPVPEDVLEELGFAWGACIPVSEGQQDLFQVPDQPQAEA